MVIFSPRSFISRKSRTVLGRLSVVSSLDKRCIRIRGTLFESESLAGRRVTATVEAAS